MFLPNMDCFLFFVLHNFKIFSCFIVSEDVDRISDRLGETEMISQQFQTKYNISIFKKNTSDEFKFMFEEKL